MNTFTLALSAALLLGSAPALHADDFQYILVRGELWHGVKIGGEAPRSLSSICRNQLCYTLKGYRVPAYAELMRFNLSNLRFDTLAAVPGVRREGDRLYLPPDLGRPLFQEAEHQQMKRRRSDND